jgi:hypothetical protein
LTIQEKLDHNKNMARPRKEGRRQMDTDLRIPMTSDQKKLVTEATADEPEVMAAWARTVLLQAARERLNQLGPSPSSEDSELGPTFRELADRWRRETGMLSSVTEKLQHPAYQAIIGMGSKAVPWILLELRDRPDHWFTALKAITGQTPVPVKDRSSFRRATEAWLAWGKEKGFIG